MDQSPESALESDEEEILVYAEFNESVNIDQYRSIHVLGINERNPVIQADDTFFTGKFDNALGTYMFFKTDPSPKSEDPLFDKLPASNLKYVLKTKKVLNMEHAYVIPKAGGEADADIKSEYLPDDDIKPVKFESVEAALDKFKSVLIPNPQETTRIETPMQCEESEVEVIHT